MSERLETLKKARERMIEDRDAHAKVLAAPFDRNKTERARSKFIERAFTPAKTRSVCRQPRDVALMVRMKETAN
jgi:hypothetical protein